MTFLNTDYECPECGNKLIYDNAYREFFCPEENCYYSEKYVEKHAIAKQDGDIEEHLKKED